MIMERAAEVLIRRMTPADLQAVLAIDRQSFPIPWSENTYRHELNNVRSTRLLVAEVKHRLRKRVVGYVGFWYVVDEAHISTLAVAPEFRGRGIGRRLLRAALDMAVQMGCRRATLEVRPSNEIAIGLYRSCGFQVVGRRPRYYRDNNEDALIMTLEPIEGLAYGGEG